MENGTWVGAQRKDPELCRTIPFSFSFDKIIANWPFPWI